MRIGATIVGASALAVGFAAPAFAAQNVNNGNASNANAQNYVVVQGGSNTTWALMSAEASLFNTAPGCDIVGVNNTTSIGGIQPLDYGCPGMENEAGTGVDQGSAQTAAATATCTGNVTNAFKKVLDSSCVQTGTTTAVPQSSFGPGDQVTDSAGDIPTADPVNVVGGASLKLKFAPTGTDSTDTIVVDYNPQQGENGYTTWGAENPFNDVVVEEPSYGSGNGIGELEGTGNAGTVGNSATLDNPDNNTSSPVNVAPLDAARSSAAPNLSAAYNGGGNYSGMNFVAYAEDAVSYVYWNKFNGLTTEAAKCIAAIQASSTGMSTSILDTIWSESYATGTPSVTWSSLDPSSSACTSAPVYAYWAQSGSGTEKTWASATGAGFPGAAQSWPSKQIVFENETSSLLGNENSAPIADTIFFFSYGDFLHKCTPAVTTAGQANYLLSTNGVCAGTSTNASIPNSIQLGTVWTGTSGAVTLEPTTINDQLPGLTGAEFKGDRLVYNVYGDGLNPNIPAANAPTLNFLSEDGFLCKPSTATDIDPYTGATYRSEIDANLSAQGFLPLPNLQVEDGQGDTTVAIYNSTATGIPHPAYNELHNSAYDSAVETGSTYKFAPANVDTDSSAWQGTYANVEKGSSTLGTQTASSSAPIGYCIVVTTDGDTAGNN